jgi:hypothetical protein
MSFSWSQGHHLTAQHAAFDGQSPQLGQDGSPVIGIWGDHLDHGALHGAVRVLAADQSGSSVISVSEKEHTEADTALSGVG